MFYMWIKKAVFKDYIGFITGERMRILLGQEGGKWTQLESSKV